jgi:PadR family transcriptional regulator, regulatory protein PadR
MAMRSRAPAAVFPEENWGDRVFQGEVKTKTVFPMLVLQMLHVQPDSGYGLMQRIGELGGVFPVNPNTVYPLLRRLEDRGFVRGVVDESTKRGTTVYRITPDGEDRLESIKSGFLPYLTKLIESLQRLRVDLYGQASSD